MPLVSQKQAALFYAAKNGYKYATEAVPQNVASKFIKDTDHQKIKGLPERIGKPGQHSMHKQVQAHMSMNAHSMSRGSSAPRTGAESNRVTE